MSVREEHQRTVGAAYRPGWRPLNRPVPALQLSGPWLERAGFAPGDEVRLVVEYGRVLVVRRDLDVEGPGE